MTNLFTMPFTETFVYTTIWISLGSGSSTMFLHTFHTSTETLTTLAGFTTFL